MVNDLIAGVTANLRAARRAPLPADIVDMLQALPPAKAAARLMSIPEARAVEALDRPEFVAAPLVLALLARPHAVRLISQMADDRAADVLAAMDADAAAPILAALAPEVRRSLDSLLAWPANSAGGMMTTEYVGMSEDATVGEVLDHIRTVERSRETIYSVFLTDSAGRLVATVSLRRLIMAPLDSPAIALARAGDPVSVPPDADRETVADLIRRHDLLALPVVEQGRVIGIVTVDDVLDALVAEHTEDTQKFGGVAALDRPYLDTGFFAMIRKRAGWLGVLFLSEMLTASAMQHFENELERAVVLTLFIPLIMSSGGNSGSQATSLIIRALALGQLRVKDWWRVALREAPTGLVLGAMLGVVGLIRIALWQELGIYDYGPHWILVGATVAAGLVGIVTFGSLAGAMLPFLLERLGFDPASASAPFVATLVDVTGLVIYFTIALAILSGTLL